MLRKTIYSIVIFFIVFNIASYFQEMMMLSGDEINTVYANQNSYEPYKLNTLMDDAISLESKDKTTILYFFAPWCVICNVSIANLEEIYLENQNIEVIAVALDYESVEEVAEFSKKHQLTFPIALGNSMVRNSFHISGYPSYYVLDKENNILAKSKGYSTKLGLYLRTL